MASDQVYNEKMAMIRGKFLTRLQKQCDGLLALQKQLETSRVPENGLGDLRMQVHMIVGTAATFGFAELGAYAVALETAMDTAMEGQQSPAGLDALRSNLERFLENGFAVLERG